MATISGYTGQFDLGTIVDSDVAYNTHSWGLDVTGEQHEITDFTTTGWKKFVGGLKSWTGSVELYVDSTNYIQPSDVAATAVMGKFYLNATHYLSGKAIVSGWHPAVSVDGVETQSIDIQGASDLSFT